MSERPVCEVCGRNYISPILFPHGCHGRSGFSARDDAECYRLGYDRVLAALSAAERERDLDLAEMRRFQREYIRADHERLAAEKREARLRGALESLQRARHAHYCDPDAADEQQTKHTPLHDSLCAAARVALELASVASEAQPPPASSVPVASSTQEGE